MSFTSTEFEEEPIVFRGWDFFLFISRIRRLSLDKFIVKV